MVNQKKSIAKLVIIMITAIGIIIVASYYYSKSYHNDVRRKKKMYVYETFSGPINSVLYVKSKDDGEKLIRYYKSVEKGENPVIDFPLIGLPTDTPVYVMGYAGKDSSLVKVVQYDNRVGKIRLEYIEGYVYKNTLHNSPPKN